MSKTPPALSGRTLIKHLAALAFGAAALLAGAAAWADPPGRVGRIAETDGTVWIFDAEQGEWIGARRNRPVTAGDRLSVERDARAELQIGSATVRLDSNTEFEVTALDDQQVRMHLHRGSLALRVRGNESAREFSVTTAEGRFDPERAGHYRIDRNDEPGTSGSFAGVLAGTLRFEARDSALEINAGQRAEFWSERGVTHYSWSTLPSDRFGEWVAQQERQDDRNARRRPYVSPEMTGAEDLDRYGDWQPHPEYGTVWFPARVEPGWAPYRYGHWAYIRPWGYTWVDDAPWGFAPFHYGRWISWQGRWAWAPGQYVARPVYAPALVAWIGGPQVSIGINIGGGPAVGWVPLSPREVYVPSYNVTNIYVTNVNSPYRRWHPPIQPNQPVRTGPIMYSNQGVPGGVTVVPQNVLRERQPISNAVIAPVDARTISRWQTQPLQPQQPAVQGRPAQSLGVPPPAPSRVIAVPGGAVPAAPGAPRSTPWGQIAAPSRGVVRPAPDVVQRPAPAVQGDGGQAQTGRPPFADPRGERPPVVERTVPGAAPQPRQREGNERRGRGQDNGRDDRQRIAPAQAAVPTAPVLQPVQPVQAAPATPPVAGAQPAQVVRTVPAPPAVQQAGQPVRVEPGARGRGQRDAEDRDERPPPPGQERRREQRREQQNQ